MQIATSLFILPSLPPCIRWIQTDVLQEYLTYQLQALYQVKPRIRSAWISDAELPYLWQILSKSCFLSTNFVYI